MSHAFLASPSSAIAVEGDLILFLLRDQFFFFFEILVVVCTITVGLVQEGNQVQNLSKCVHTAS